ncbi:hypothetical protein PV10_05871 [Exophiala mesophila]|uniref:Transcription initiation factor TFIID subunit 13 n=1 Tax=Exophiala mesophila TaxID=212818 RepID=A0A0D1WQE4_EXOME|nr:uncharacterized protein PV10_05871 [Exophiala mesophila]KIV91320.1 hypothetical protein PV10_05871 [Exophiala mesophila]
MEPRARAGRHKAGLNFGAELEGLLHGYGAAEHPDLSKPIGVSSQRYLDNPRSNNGNNTHPPTPFNKPFPETIRVLDEMLTDFIIETCHNAVTIATYSGRAKLKLSDFEFVLRRDAVKLGRVQEMFKKKRDIDNKKKLFDTNEGKEGAKMNVGDLMNLGEVIGEEGTGKGKGRGRGRRKKRDREAEAGGDAAGVGAAGDDDHRDEHTSKKPRSEVG